MNRALLYLWWALLRRRAWHCCRALRRPTTLIGFAYVAGLVGFLFYFRGHEIFAQLVRREVLLGGALIMLCGSVFKWFLQRGLVFEPPDIEFVFTSPFTQRQILLYRLLPQYVYAVIQGLVFGALFAPHFRQPWLAAACMTLFQAACFHLATAAAVFGGAISERLHYRLRWMMLGGFFLLGALYLRAAWEIELVPAFVRSPLAQLFFYPAATLPDATASPVLHRWILGLAGAGGMSPPALLRPALYLAGFGLGVMLSLWGLLQFKTSLFEPSLGTTTRLAEERLRVRQGRAGSAGKMRARSARLPGLPLFQGVGALVWKNLVVARRSRRELLVAFAFVAVYSTFLTALLWKFHQLSAQTGPVSGADALYVKLTFHLGVALFIATLAFFLQRMFPFDFRRDGRHLLGFRTLPMPPLALALAEVAVPTLLVLASQAVGLVALLIFARFPWPLLVLLLLGYPAIALALNSVWNLHYLLAATRQAAGRAQSASPVGTLMVVVLSFLVFFPAAWTADRLRHCLTGPYGLSITVGTALAIQFAVDFLLILALAELFQRFEISREAPGGGHG
ncbi:MAG: putative ABC exporter domain-containing protein [Verrucomicrobiota bacterium]